MTTVLLVDDQAVVREGLRGILEPVPDITVVGEAANGLQAVEMAERFGPDVVLMDVRMPRMDGIEATRRILGTPPPTPRILMLSTFGEEEYVYGALRAGATGFLLKDAERSEIVQGIRSAALGDRLLAPELTRRLIEAYVRRGPANDGTPAQLSGLTSRELEVVRLVAQGLSNGELADRLSLSEATVKSHISHILQKVGTRDRIQLVVLAYECGLIEPGVDDFPG